MRKQPVITAVSIIGTALAIFLVMVIVMMNKVKTSPFAPESNRDRWLINKCMSIVFADGINSCNGAMSFTTAKEIYYRMKTPEAVAIFDSWPERVTLSVSGREPFNVDAMNTDDGFWRVMDFKFISGGPYDKAEFDAGRTEAVIAESVARRLFDTSDAVGREFDVDYVTFRVAGVVEDVSPLADLAYAQIWLPITATNALYNSWADDVMGSLGVIILAKDKSDFPEIRREFEQLHKAFFDSHNSGMKYVQRERPYDQETNAYTPWANGDPDMDKVLLDRYMVFAVLLLIPAINLSSMTHSRLCRQRRSIGVKRAFGATKLNIMTSLFVENFIITVVAGAIGLVLSVVFAYIGSDTLFATDYRTPSSSINFSATMVMQWSTFAWALLFCFILNLVSAGIPSIQAARTNIVNALSDK